MRYLDPKNDLTFKKIFGQHPHLLKSFLNALMPLQEGQQIVSLEYLPAELVPEIPVLKHSIVDVRCVDNYSRQFIVEMQMLWTDSFKSRVLFNASKAYVKQLEKSKGYKSLDPVFSLSLVNQDFDKDTESYYHHYNIVHTENSNKKMEGLEFVFIELPKFKAKNLTEKKLQVLWLKFIAEMESYKDDLLKDLSEIPEIKEALLLLEESSYSVTELETYDKYWDSIRSEKTLLIDVENKGIAKGIIKGEIKGKKERNIEIAKKLLRKNMPIEQIAEITDLTVEEIRKLKNA